MEVIRHAADGQHLMPALLDDAGDVWMQFFFPSAGRMILKRLQFAYKVSLSIRKFNFAVVGLK